MYKYRTSNLPRLHLFPKFLTVENYSCQKKQFLWRVNAAVKALHLNVKGKYLQATAKFLWEMFAQAILIVGENLHESFQGSETVD